ncbi:MAG: hypothetical protein KBT27_13095 [Prevotellaceae bacterium]|nr:hypothetical protein [Candidatus Faecinaster equi]
MGLFKAYGFFDNAGKLIRVVPSIKLEEAETWFKENYPDIEYMYLEVLTNKEQKSMKNRCIGCYYHDSKENVCTHGSPIFIDDTCTDYQDSEFVKQIRAEVICELLKPYDVESIEDLLTNVYNKGKKEGRAEAIDEILKKITIYIDEMKAFYKETQDSSFLCAIAEAQKIRRIIWDMVKDQK